MDMVLVGFFDVPEYGIDSVETPVEGRPAEQYERLNELILQRWGSQLPKGTILRRVGSVVELRDENNGFVEITPGTTISQLFVGPNDEVETSRTVGKVFFNSSPMKVVIVLSRSGGFVSVSLTPVLRQDGAIRFGSRISPQMLASELPRLIQEVLGSDARDLKLNFREANPQTKT